MDKTREEGGVQPTQLPHPWNDDAEILVRLDECDHLIAECPNKDCPFTKLLKARKQELKRSLVDHWLIA